MGQGQVIKIWNVSVEPKLEWVSEENNISFYKPTRRKICHKLLQKWHTYVYESKYVINKQGFSCKLYLHSNFMLRCWWGTYWLQSNTKRSQEKNYYGLLWKHSSALYYCPSQRYTPFRLEVMQNKNTKKAFFRAAWWTTCAVTSRNRWGKQS